METLGTVACVHFLSPRRWKRDFLVVIASWWVDGSLDSRVQAGWLEFFKTLSSPLRRARERDPPYLDRVALPTNVLCENSSLLGRVTQRKSDDLIFPQRISYLFSYPLDVCQQATLAVQVSSVQFNPSPPTPPLPSHPPLRPPKHPHNSPPTSPPN